MRAVNFWIGTPPSAILSPRKASSVMPLPPAFLRASSTRCFWLFCFMLSSDIGTRSGRAIVPGRPLPAALLTTAASVRVVVVRLVHGGVDSECGPCLFGRVPCGLVELGLRPPPQGRGVLRVEPDDL